MSEFGLWSQKDLRVGRVGSPVSEQGERIKRFDKDGRGGEPVPELNLEQDGSDRGRTRRTGRGMGSGRTMGVVGAPPRKTVSL